LIIFIYVLVIIKVRLPCFYINDAILSWPVIYVLVQILIYSNICLESGIIYQLKFPFSSRGKRMEGHGKNLRATFVPWMRHNTARQISCSTSHIHTYMYVGTCANRRAIMTIHDIQKQSFTGTESYLIFTSLAVCTTILGSDTRATVVSSVTIRQKFCDSAGKFQ